MLAYAFKSKPTDVSNIHASDLMNFDKDKQKIQIENQKNVQGQRAGGAGIVDIQRLSNSRNLGMDFDGSENPNKNPKVMKNPVLSQNQNDNNNHQDQRDQTPDYFYDKNDGIRKINGISIKDLQEEQEGPERQQIKLDESIIQKHEQNKVLDTIPIKLLGDKMVDESTNFLLPILKFGPSEQVLGLYESLLLATFMNRTLVLPPFYFHGSDNQHSLRKRFVPPELRINVFELTNTLTPGPAIVSLDQYKKFCKSTPEVLFQATNVFFEGNGVKTSRINDFERAAGQKLLSKSNSGRSFLPGILKIPDFDIDKFTINNVKHSLNGKKEKGIRDLSLNEVEDFIRKDWMNIFSPEATQNLGKCGMLLLPSKTVQKPPKELTNSIKPPLTFSFSPEIENAATKFLQTIKYLTVGVHWRYNNNDFNNKCAKRAPKDRPQECKLVKNIDFKKLAKNLFVFSNFLNIYVAAPATSVKSLLPLSTFSGDEFSQENNSNASKESEDSDYEGESNQRFTSKIYTSKDLKKFLDENFENHEFYKHYEGEAVSLVEQCILSKLDYFYPWPVSAWSIRVLTVRERNGLGNRMDLFKLLENSQKGGIQKE